MRNITAVIPAAGKPTNKIIGHSNMPDTMLPINGKPVIGYIIEDLISRGIKNIIIIINKNDLYTDKYLNKKFKNKCDLNIIINKNSERGLGYSIHLSKPYTPPGHKIFICLGDTIYKGDLNFENNFLIISKQYEESSKWCFVEKNINDKLSFTDKPLTYEGSGSVLCGLYFFNNNKIFNQALDECEKENEKIEMSNILQKYNQHENFDLVEARGWYDCGNLENYYKAKIDFLRVRGFNSIEYNDLFGHITKTSSKKENIIREINWFQNIPNELKIFAPRLIDHKTEKNSAKYSIEYYGYQTLADMFIFNIHDIKLWRIIIKRLLEIFEIFQTHKNPLPYSSFYEIYYKKTIDRLNRLKEQNEYWQKLMDKEEISINGKKYKNINNFLPHLEKYTEHLYDPDKTCVIHGDPCLSNILFDPSGKIFKFIDPRGHFGEMSVYGHSKYDLAKLRHSFNGCYEFIISDLFEINEDGDGKYEYKVYTEEHHDKIKEYFDEELTKNNYDLKKIKLIEALLFLSMVPLHDDNFKRQKAMYLTGIKLINEINI